MEGHSSKRGKKELRQSHEGWGSTSWSKAGDNAALAKRLLHRLLKKRSIAPRVRITDKYVSYDVAKRAHYETHQVSRSDITLPVNA